jgi:hypothetical protein
VGLWDYGGIMDGDGWGWIGMGNWGCGGMEWDGMEWDEGWEMDRVGGEMGDRVGWGGVGV